MTTNVITGTQWGDEGKGKIVDTYAQKADVVVRFHGGNNAGHSLVIDNKKIVVHTLPSGIVRSGVLNLVGPYVVCDLETIKNELEIAKQHGSKVALDYSAPIILPIHKTIDKAREANSGKNFIGTTGKGIGPCYEDFWSRKGIKLSDLWNKNILKEALKKSHYLERCNTARGMGEETMSIDATVEYCMEYAPHILPHLGDTRAVIAQMQEDDKNILFEGAHGIMLDTLHGALPYCTSSICTSSAISASLGIYKIDNIIGIAKAYTTRVGEGPFPTELFDSNGKILGDKGFEFGSTTGRKRRCGWMDLVALRYACRMGGITSLVITKLDVLSGFEKIKICTGYEYLGKALNKYATLSREIIENSKPVYEEFNGWHEDISECRYYAKLPENAKTYLEFVSEFLQLSIIAIGVGADRNQVITL